MSRTAAIETTAWVKGDMTPPSEVGMPPGKKERSLSSAVDQNVPGGALALPPLAPVAHGANS